jgi:uncharacterized membrane protein YgcG
VKCIRCGRDSKYKDRAGKRCPGCRERFAFEPHDGDRLTDMAFKAAIDAVSAGGRLRWGVEHLYYDVCRRWNRGAVKGWHVAVVVTGFAVLFVSGVVLKCIALILGGIATFFLYRNSGRPELVAMGEFNRLWIRWKIAHGEPQGVILRQPLAPPARAQEADLGDYSFDRAVICDRARTADLLLANNFHFEHNCAVLSIEGYPPGPFATVRAMLKRNPRLQVFALHDATPAGCRMAYTLAHDPEWFKDHALITDVGLRPVHANRISAPWLPPVSGAVAAGDGLAADEAQWLSQHALELAVFRPETILKQMFAAMTRKKDSSDGGGGYGGGDGGGSSDSHVVNDNVSFSGQGGESGGGGADDSFG